MLKRKPPRPVDTHALWRDTVNAFTVGWNLALPIFGGVLLGYFLDRLLHTVYIFTIGLLLFGIFIGFYILMRTIQRLDSDSSKKNEPPKGDQPPS
jgi:F0F1-type ATP synthase assembly protein I